MALGCGVKVLTPLIERDEQDEHLPIKVLIFLLFLLISEDAQGAQLSHYRTRSDATG